MSYGTLKFGIFLAPFHSLKENPTNALDRDLALVELLDDLAYDYAWIGEHHSAGFEIIASPEIFIAAVAERTKHIKFGTGVASLPYHHPFILADRIMQLDHMTRGRVAFGVGPGLLSIGATSLGGFNALASNWKIYERKAAQHSQVADRSGWSLVGPMHLAETREQALANVTYGIETWVEYFQEVAALPIAPPACGDTAQYLIDRGLAELAHLRTPSNKSSACRKNPEVLAAFCKWPITGQTGNKPKKVTSFSRVTSPRNFKTETATERRVTIGRQKTTPSEKSS